MTTLPRDFRHLDRWAQRLIAVLLNQCLLFFLRGDVSDVVRVLAENHAVAGALGIRLFRVDDADIIEELVPEAGVQQVKRRVLHTAVIPVNGGPIGFSFFGDGSILVVRVHIAQIIPAGACPLGHGVRLAFGRAAAARASSVDPVGHLRQWAFAIVSRLIAVNLRKNNGQLLLGNRHPAALRAGDHRDGLAPVALAGENPVAQLVIHFLMAPTLLDGILLHGRDSFLDSHAVEEAGIDHDAGIVLERKRTLGDIAALNDLDDRQTELRCKVPVSLIVAWNAHDNARAVTHKNIIGDEHRHDLAGGRIRDLDALKADAGLVLVEFAAFKIGLAGSCLLVSFDVGPVGDALLPLVQQWMLRGNDGIRHTEERVNARW